MTIHIRPEIPADRQAIWNVNRVAFQGDTEANLIDALRAGGFVTLSFVAERESEIVGHILFSEVVVGSAGGPVRALALAPLAVLPPHQRQGIGSKLVIEGLAECGRLGHKIVTVLGHPDYYPRFGFSAELAGPLISPFGDGQAWMALELASGSLLNISGPVEYAPPFLAFG